MPEPNPIPQRDQWQRKRDAADGKKGLVSGVSIGDLLHAYHQAETPKDKLKKLTLLQAGLKKYHDKIKTSYPKLAKLVNLLDKSQRFLIISSMVATPKQTGNTLSVSLRLDTFVRSAPGDQS